MSGNGGVDDMLRMIPLRSLYRSGHAAGCTTSRTTHHAGESAHIANDAGVKLLIFYYLLPAPDGWLLRRLVAQGIDEVRRGDWTIADDGSLYTLPIGSNDVRRGRVTAE